MRARRFCTNITFDIKDLGTERIRCLCGSWEAPAGTTQGHLSKIQLLLSRGNDRTRDIRFEVKTGIAY